MGRLFNILTVFLISALPCFAQDGGIPKAPDFINPVVDVDGTGLLDASQIKALSEKIIRYNDTTSTELLVVLVNTTRGEEPTRFATDLGHEWKIGQKGQDNGIVLLVAKDDRKIAIATGRGTEARLTDAMSKRIIDQIIKPEFVSSNYYGGIDKGVDAIVQVLKGEFKGSGSRNNDDGGGEFFIAFFVFALIILFIFLRAKGGGRGGRGGGRRGGLDLTDIIVLSSLGSSHGRGGGFGGGFGGGGGGFGGFGGGGSFGGGGASGGW